MRTGIDFKSSHFDPVLGFALDLIKLRGLEIYSPVLIVGFEILHKIRLFYSSTDLSDLKDYHFIFPNKLYKELLFR